MKIVQITEFCYAEGKDFIKLKNLKEFKKLKLPIALKLDNKLYHITDVCIFWVEL